MQTQNNNTDNNYKRNGEHILISLTYIAKHTAELTGLDLTRELEQWRRYLEKLGVVSMLVINDNYFIQNFQGPRPLINAVLARIMVDYPEIAAHVVDMREIDALQWRGFLIKHLTTSVEDEEYALKHFSSGHDFNPYMMNSAQIAGFLNAMFKDKRPQHNTK